MKENKKTIILSVIGVLALLLIVGSSTYAYFTAVMDGNEADVNVTTATIGSLTYTVENITGTTILPGWSSENKSVVVTMDESDEEVNYTCELTITSNNITDLYLTVTGDNAVSITDRQISNNETIVIASGSIGSNETKTTYYNLTFKETGLDQNDQQGASVSGTVTCTTSGTTLTIEGKGIDTVVQTITTIPGVATYTIVPNSIIYSTEGATATCVNGSVTSIAGNVLTISNIGGNDRCTISLLKQDVTFIDKLLEDNPTRLIRTSFNSALTVQNTGTLYMQNGNWTEDVTGDGIGEVVYYFAGKALNNWVKFGKDSTGADLYWRIIRTNEDDSVRLLYFGTSTNTIAGYINGTSYPYNSATYDTMYAGYMYGTTGSLANNRLNSNSSSIKNTIDAWYRDGLNVQTDKTYSYDFYVSRTAIYCNDRATSSYGSSGQMYYAAYDRLGTNKYPSYKCGNQISGNLYSTADAADKFSVSTASGGNGKLAYPVALMTADEIVYATGTTASTNQHVWYYNNSSDQSVVSDNKWFTLTPVQTTGNNSPLIYAVYGSTAPASLFFSHVTGNNNYNVIRPVLSLKSCITWADGDGSSSNPYTVSIDETCAQAEN